MTEMVWRSKGWLASEVVPDAIQTDFTPICRVSGGETGMENRLVFGGFIQQRRG